MTDTSQLPATGDGEDKALNDHLEDVLIAYDGARDRLARRKSPKTIAFKKSVSALHSYVSTAVQEAVDAELSNAHSVAIRMLKIPARATDEVYNSALDDFGKWIVGRQAELKARSRISSEIEQEQT